MDENEVQSQVQLQAEIAWCVEQLKLSLETGKLNEKRTAESKKVLKLLQNPKTPLIKLRQAMRTTFGDYRAKMAEEAKLHKLEVKPNSVTQVTADNKGSKSLFVKKAKSNFTNKTGAIAEGGFKFNFTVDPEEK